MIGLRRAVLFCLISLPLVLTSSVRAGGPAGRDLVKLEKKLTALAKDCIPKTVCIRNFMKDMEGRGAHGSGAVISPDGEILTCSHVIADTEKLEVFFPDGRVLEAKVLGECYRNDYALIKVDAKNLEYFELGDSDALTLGEWVCALGHPGGPNMDFQPAFAAGCVTGLKKTLPLDLWSRTYVGAVQTDVPIFAGNSGGPLVDLEGRLLGLNGAILLVNENAYAVAVNLIKANIEKLRRGKYVEGKTGGGDITDLMDDPDSGLRDTALLEKVTKFCGKHGISERFMLYGKLKEFRDGGGNVDRLISDIEELKKKGEDVRKTLDELFDLGLAGDEEKPEPAERFPKPIPAGKLREPILGFRVSPDPPEGLEGVRVVTVKRRSIAARAGLMPGDIITAVGDLTISSPDDFTLLVSWVRISRDVGETRFIISIIRDGRPKLLAFSLDEEKEGR
ncbi:MAG: S1C family serine protease [Planctomycetota bacterium]|jgi:serine protease Do